MCCQWSSTLEKTSVGKRGEPLAGHLTGVERRERVWGGEEGGKRAEVMTHGRWDKMGNGKKWRIERYGKMGSAGKMGRHERKWEIRRNGN